MESRSYFFCGIGGSGMLPLALILHGQGHRVQGSDRALDQGMTPDKFDFLRAQGIDLFPQDGSGVTSQSQILVTSAAVEDSVPDVAAARHLGAAEIRRAALLAELFNAAPTSIGIAGTSGKSTVTGMVGWILHAIGRDTGAGPTILNGAVMTNFSGQDTPFASSVMGGGDALVSEVDESDGSISLYRPNIAVLTNVSEDHKSLDELRGLFGGYLTRAETAVINADDRESRALTATLTITLSGPRVITFAIDDDASDTDLVARNLTPAPDGIGFSLWNGTEEVRNIQLRVPGRHNVSNALAALGAAHAAGAPLAEAAEALEGFTGLRRRLETVGSAAGITVIDDFAHNPDKITATLATLHDFPGRLLILFQPHGFGPLRKMRDGFVDTFSQELGPEDVLLMPEPVYFGGTVAREISSREVTDGIAARGRQAEAFETRNQCADRLLELATSGDRIIIMGARDDSLASFARDLVERIGGTTS